MKIRANVFNIIPVIILVIVILVIPLYGQDILTEHEKTNFEQYTSYENLMKFLVEIRASSQEMQLGTYGKSLLGRDLPYAVFSRSKISKPWEAKNSGKLIVMLAANVHGGERTLRESLLLQTRELATPGSEANKLLDELIVIIVPTMNPDGFEKQPRPTRGNAHNIDMNRDYMKLEQPALANYVKNILHTWHPYVFVDGHNGGSFPYQVCYQGPSMASTDQRLTLLCDQEIFPFIDRKMEQSGYRSWYYSGGNKERWRVGGSDPRIGRNYGGLINSVGILFESPGRQDKKIGALSGHVAYKAVLQYAYANTEKIKMYVDRANLETVDMGKNARGEVVIQMKYEPVDYKVSYLIGEGRGDNRKIVEVHDAELVKKPVATKTRPRPYAYLLPQHADKAIEMLKRHNIRIEQLVRDTELETQCYTLDSVSYTHEYDHPASVIVHVAEVVTKTSTFPKGTYVIQTGQNLGRVVTHILEPETNDNIVKWNTLDYILPVKMSQEQIRMMNERRRARGMEPRERQKTELPIYKIMIPTSLPTKIVDF